MIRLVFYFFLSRFAKNYYLYHAKLDNQTKDICLLFYGRHVYVPVLQKLAIFHKSKVSASTFFFIKPHC